jgi:hypothetical protein
MASVMSLGAIVTEVGSSMLPTSSNLGSTKADDSSSGCRVEIYEGCLNKACWDQAIGQVQQVCTDGTVRVPISLSHFSSSSRSFLSMTNTIDHQFDCINKYGWPSQKSATKRSSSEFRHEDAVNGSCSMLSADLFKTVD